MEAPDSIPETLVQHSNEEEATEDVDDAAINNAAVEPLPHIPSGLEVAEARNHHNTHDNNDKTNYDDCRHLHRANE